MKKLIYILPAFIAITLAPAHAVTTGGGRGNGVEKQNRELQVPEEAEFLKLSDVEIALLCGRGSRAASDVSNGESTVSDKRSSGTLVTNSPLAPRVETLYKRIKAALDDRASDPGAKAIIDKAQENRYSLSFREKEIRNASDKRAKFKAISLYLSDAERLFRSIGEYKRDRNTTPPAKTPRTPSVK